MPEVVNTSFLGDTSSEEELNGSSETMIKVDDVSMVFNMASETMNNLKEYAIALAKRELHFKEFRALDHVSLEVKKGDVFGILGTNGSGKSTLLKIIAGVLEPSEGTCTVNGSIAPLIELGAGFDMELTARENIYLNGALLGYSKKFIEQHFEEIVEFAEIEQFLDMPLKNYSSGMVARIAFAIATVIVPEILIVDEVLSVGDFMFQQKCERRINTLIKEHGVTVLIVSHSNDQIERLCNKAIWIEKGHERIAGSAHDVCRVYRMLGGRIGSAEAELQVNQMLHLDIPIPQGVIKVISKEDRYSTAVNLFENYHNNNGHFDKVIIASGEDSPTAFLGSSLSSKIGLPILLTRRDSLPDITANTLKQHGVKQAIAIGNQNHISDHVFSSIEKIIGTFPQRVSAETYNEIANILYCSFPQTESQVAILTYPNCTADLLSLTPFIAQNKVPVFYHVENGIIGKQTLEILTSGIFKQILILGGQTSFPDASLTPLEDKGLNIVRFCGKNPFDANKIINDWIKNNCDLDYSGLYIISPENPEDGLTLITALKKDSYPILLESPRNLDSIAEAFSVIKSNNTQSLVFVGNESVFNMFDREILAKSVATNLS